MSAPSLREPGKTGRTPNRSRYWRRKFLNALAAGQTISMACLTSGVPKSSAYWQRRRDPNFARAWDDALDRGLAVLEAELHRRAVDGVERGVYFQGERIAVERHYSDRMLLRALEMRSAAWAARSAVAHEHSGQVEVFVAPAPAELPCNGRDLIHQPGQCAACDATRAAAIDGTAEAAPMPAPAPPLTPPPPLPPPAPRPAAPDPLRAPVVGTRQPGP